MRTLLVVVAWLVTTIVGGVACWLWFEALGALMLRIADAYTARAAVLWMSIGIGIAFVVLSVVVEYAYSHAPNLGRRIALVGGGTVAFAAVGFVLREALGAGYFF